MVSNLACPRCSQTLVTEKRGAIEVDACPDCKGMFLDYGEVEQLVQDKDVLQKVFSGNLVNVQNSTISCPKCGLAMKMLKGGLVSPVLLVDKCPSCQGLWLDNRELDLVQKLLAGLKSTPS